jgi:hypothetical protein
MIENPNPDSVTAKITYMNPALNTPTGKGIVAVKTITLPAMSQTTINPESDLPFPCDFSTKIECTDGKTIAVDRTMTWNGPGAASPEAHSSIGVTSPSNTWYLPEGSTNWGFETWTLIENPTSTDASVTLTYMIEGAGPRSFTKSVPANSRFSVKMSDDVGNADASIGVSSPVPVIAEESVYRNNKREGSCSIGATAPSKDFYLSEGTTAWGFTTYVLVQNPNPDPANVTLTYMTPGGPKVQPAFTMPGNSRKTIRVNDIRDVSNTDLSTQVSSDKPIIAERSMYWGAGTPLGEACHASIGLSAPHTTFYLPDGEAKIGAGVTETYTLVANPNPDPVNVEVSYLTPTGTNNVVFTDTIGANSRKTYNMQDRYEGKASIMVRSLSPGEKIMVERSMYWNGRGAGTNTIGGYSD